MTLVLFKTKVLRKSFKIKSERKLTSTNVSSSKLHLDLSNGLGGGVHECDEWTTDRQTTQRRNVWKYLEEAAIPPTAGFAPRIMRTYTYHSVHNVNDLLSLKSVQLSWLVSAGAANRLD